MSHVFEVTDDQYQAIEEAAKERGQAPEDFFRSWVDAVRRYAAGSETDPEQAWFWTPEWQAKEREADEAIAAGNGDFYDTPEAFLAALDEE
jgi:hypothetical protein